MKDLRIRHTALLLFIFLLASVSLSAQTGLQQKLSEISAITETQPLESTEFSEKYVTYSPSRSTTGIPRKEVSASGLSWRTRASIVPRSL